MVLGQRRSAGGSIYEAIVKRLEKDYREFREEAKERIQAFEIKINNFKNVENRYSASGKRQVSNRKYGMPKIKSTRSRSSPRTSRTGAKPCMTISRK